MSFELLILNGDVVFSDGDLKTISGEQKLIQDILKISITAVGANVLQPWYGSFINQTLIGSVLDPGVTEVVAQNQLQDALENLKKLQNLQLNSGKQSMTPSEMIAAIRQVTVSRSPVDPRTYNVFISVLSKTFSSTNVSFSV